MAQIKLFDTESYILAPSFIKFYTIYKYDHIKFRELRKAWLKTEEGKHRTYRTLKNKQQEFLELCYERDENGKLVRDSDEKHIYRTRTLQSLHELIYQSVNPSTTVSGLILYDDEKQAELKDTWDMPIGDRVKVHIKVLRKLRGKG